MSYSDYGDEPRRSNRRATREPAEPARVQGSTAAAILVFVAIVGFGIGALIGNSGNSGGDGTDSTAVEDDSGNAAAGGPDSDSANPDGTEGEQDNTEGEDGTGTEDGGEDGDTDENGTSAPTDPSGGSGITLTSPQDGGEVSEGESGTIEVEAALESGEEGVTLSVERSLDGGQTWESFCDACTDETTGNGTHNTNFWTGQTGENLFRVVGPDGLVSNTIAVTVVEGDGDGNGDDSG